MEAQQKAVQALQQQHDEQLVALEQQKAAVQLQEQQALQRKPLQVEQVKLAAQQQVQANELLAAQLNVSKEHVKVLQQEQQAKYQLHQEQLKLASLEQNKRDMLALQQHGKQEQHVQLEQQAVALKQQEAELELRQEQLNQQQQEVERLRQEQSRRQSRGCAEVFTSTTHHAQYITCSQKAQVASRASTELARQWADKKTRGSVFQKYMACGGRLDVLDARLTREVLNKTNEYGNLVWQSEAEMSRPPLGWDPERIEAVKRFGPHTVQNWQSAI